MFTLIATVTLVDKTVPYTSGGKTVPSNQPMDSIKLLSIFS